jgi:hypothetical protein
MTHGNVAHDHVEFHVLVSFLQLLRHGFRRRIIMRRPASIARVEFPCNVQCMNVMSVSRLFIKDFETEPMLIDDVNKFVVLLLLLASGRSVFPI